MTTEEKIIHLFCDVDDQMSDVPKHRQAKLYPSEWVTIGLLFALKGGRFRAFYRWLKGDFNALFGGLPDRTRLQRSLAAHQDWCDGLLAVPSGFTFGDSYPIEWLFPIREGRTARQIGRKGKDKGRWFIGCWTRRAGCSKGIGGLLIRPDQDFNALVEPLNEPTMALLDWGFRDKNGVPPNVKLCKKGTWNERMVIETAFSMLTVICQAKKWFHRVADGIWSHCAYLAAMVNALYALFHQLHPDESVFKMSIAEFSL